MDLERGIEELLALTERERPRLPRFSLENFCGKHVKQLAFAKDRHHRKHVMCARQVGKSYADDGILLDAGLTLPQSTNIILGINGPQIRNNNWEPIWKRQFDKFSGLDGASSNETRMVTTFPNGARVFFGGVDDARHIKNLLGGRVERGVVIIDESQDAGPMLDELLDSILPPMLGAGAQLILSGVFPEVPAGRFWRESGWHERDGQWTQDVGFHGWSHHNWGRRDNVFTPDAWALLERYLEETGLSMNDPQIIRDWMGLPSFDPEATAYRYLKSRNGYDPVTPEWLRMIYGQAKDGVAVDERGKEIKYAHEMRIDKDGGRYGMMAAIPHEGVNIFGGALDPGSNSDRASIQFWGWGERYRGVQHVFDWTSQRRARLSTGDMFAVLGLAYRMLLKVGDGAGACNPRYDAGSSQNTIDNLQGDYGIPLVLAAKKSDLIGQINRNNDLLTDGRAKVMIGSALEQDYTRARWDKAALERGQRVWARAWHPDSSEAGRYGLQDYYEAAVEKHDPNLSYGYKEPIPSTPAIMGGGGDTGYGSGSGWTGGDPGGGGGYGGGFQP